MSDYPNQPSPLSHPPAVPVRADAEPVHPVGGEAFEGEALQAIPEAKAFALEQAVTWAGQGGDWKGEQPTAARIIQVAETFEAYLISTSEVP
jgi:hypothetical protein